MEKLCTDCEHSRRDWFFGWEFATCEAPQNKTIRLLDGKPEYKFAKFCDVQRKYGDIGDCSPSGKWFEPKRTTFFMRLLKA